MSLTFLDDEEPLFAKRRTEEKMFERRDTRDTSVYGKVFKIFECINTDYDIMSKDCDGNNLFNELIGIGLGFELQAAQTVSFFANVEMKFRGEGVINKLYGDHIKIVVDGVDDATSQRNLGMCYPVEMFDEQCYHTANTQTTQSLSVGYHRVSIRFKSDNHTNDSSEWGRVYTVKASIIAILGG